MASQVAIHEAGHLYASIRYGIPVAIAAITPDHAKYHGIVTSPDEHLKTLFADDFDGYGWLDALDDEDTAVIRRTIMVLLAGAASERVFFGANDSRSANDYAKAHQLATAIHAGSADLAQLFVNYLEPVVQEFVDSNRDFVIALADALDERGHLNEADARAIIRGVVFKGGTWPPK